MRRKIYAILHNIRSAYNVGSMLRTADGLGVDKLFLTGYTADPTNRKVLKTSLGAEKKVLWEKERSVGKIIKELRIMNVEIISVETGVDGVPLKKIKLKKNQDVVFIFGNERRGINGKILNNSDMIVAIPMEGTKESFNVSVAFGIVIYHFKSI